mgnify:CR=1 FL=1
MLDIRVFEHIMSSKTKPAMEDSDSSSEKVLHFWSKTDADTARKTNERA